MAEGGSSGISGGWSINAILAGFDSGIDRPSDPLSSGRALAFEQALAEELQKAGHANPFDKGVDPENGAALSRAGEDQWSFARLDRVTADVRADGSAAEAQEIGASDRRVGFGGDDASSRLSSDGDDLFEADQDAGSETAFRIDDRAAFHLAFEADDHAFLEDERFEPTAVGRVFFNGDGRPIILPPIDPAAVVDEGAGEGDLMILPNGAVLAYHPWTATVEGVR